MMTTFIEKTVGGGRSGQALAPYHRVLPERAAAEAEGGGARG
jgi:hypothetical protein